MKDIFFISESRKKVYLKLLNSSKKKFYFTKIEEARNSSKEI